MLIIRTIQVTSYRNTYLLMAIMTIDQNSSLATNLSGDIQSWYVPEEREF
jgi:hypothetical protein